MRALMIAAALGTGVVLNSVQAFAIAYTADRSSWLAAVSGTVTTTDFEENPSGGFTYYGNTYNGTGFTIQSLDDVFTVDPDYKPKNYQWNSGDVLTTGRKLTTINGGRNFAFEFSVPEQIFFLDDPSSGYISIYFPGVATPYRPFLFNDEPRTMAFIGLLDMPGPLTIDWGGGLGIIDNFSVAQTEMVPVPGTLTLLGLGLAGLASSRRRRQ